MKKPTQTVAPANSASCATATGVTTGNSLPVVQPHPDFVKTVKFLWVGIGLFFTSFLVICLIGSRNHGVPSWLVGVFTLELFVFVLFLVMLSARHPCRQTVLCPKCRQLIRQIADEDRDRWIAPCQQCDVVWDLMFHVSGD